MKRRVEAARIGRVATTGVVAGLTPAIALAQPTVSVDFTGASVSSLSTSPADLVRTSAGTISPAEGYLFEFNPTVHTTGILGGLLFPNQTPLGDVLNFFVPGQQRITRGAMRNPGGAIPVTLDTEIVGGTFSGFTISLTFEQMILATGQGQAAIRNIQKPFGLGIAVDSGGAVFTTFTPPPAQTSEFHFDGDLLSVKETGLAPGAGNGKLRYLDDPAFGPILGGPGAETTYPTPPTPQDVTRQQSSFGTTTSFGIPSINGEEDTIYLTSPPRNLADPTNQAKSRGIGLAFFPNTRDTWPEDRLGQWTMVWDMLIPAASWSSEFVTPLIEDNHNNDSSADSFIHSVGAAAEFGYNVDVNSYLGVPLAPDTWFRLALSSDGYRTKAGRVFVNGTFVGTTGGDWVYASTRSTDPRYGDLSSANPTGTAVPPATWAAWGEFPSPWAQAPTSTLAPMASTVCLFADLQGRGERVYVANFMCTDEAMSDAEIIALGGPNARGIVHLRPILGCVADVDDGTGTGTPDGGVTIDDLLYYLAIFNVGSVAADVDDGSGTGLQDGGVTIDDLLYYLARFNAGC